MYLLFCSYYLWFKFTYLVEMYFQHRYNFPLCFQLNKYLRKRRPKNNLKKESISVFSFFLSLYSIINPKFRRLGIHSRIIINKFCLVAYIFLSGQVRINKNQHIFATLKQHPIYQNLQIHLHC